MLPKLCIIFTVATASLLVGSHSAAAQYNAAATNCRDSCAQVADCAETIRRFTIMGRKDELNSMRQWKEECDRAGRKCPSCHNGGTVSDTTDNCVCNCVPPWGGADCQELKCTAGANGASCQNGGTVSGNKDYGYPVYTTDNCGCNCATGYEGANCQTAKACTAGANGASCQNGGTAFGTTDNCGCSCPVNKQPVGFVGANCQTPKACDQYTRKCIYRPWWSCYMWATVPNVGCISAVAQARAGQLSAGDDDGDGNGEEGGVVLNEDLTDTEKAEMSAGCTLFKESDGQVLPEWAAQVNESATTVITMIKTICAELDVEGAAAIATLETTTTNTQPTPSEVARTVFAGIIAACCLYVVWIVATRKTLASNKHEIDVPEDMAEISEI